MVQKFRFIIPILLLLGSFLFGCPRKIPEPLIIEKPPIENPIHTLIKTFSAVDSFQAKALIRIDMVRSGEEMRFFLNGFIFYQKPDRLRLIGYHPLGMGLFDALYRSGDFYLLIPIQKKVYIGEVSQFEGLMEKAGPIQISTERVEGNQIPSQIRIDVVEKETQIELKLREVSIGVSIPEDSFQWFLPEGVEVESLLDLIRKKLR